MKTFEKVIKVPVWDQSGKLLYWKEFHLSDEDNFPSGKIYFYQKDEEKLKEAFLQLDKEVLYNLFDEAEEYDVESLLVCFTDKMKTPFVGPVPGRNKFGFLYLPIDY